MSVRASNALREYFRDTTSFTPTLILTLWKWQSYVCVVFQPLFVRQDTLKAFEFRIRNLPYPADNYDLSIDAETSSEIILRTKNKKYFKKITIVDMKIGAFYKQAAETNYGEEGKLKQEYLSFKHANNTLIIHVRK